MRADVLAALACPDCRGAVRWATKRGLACTGAADGSRSSAACPGCSPREGLGAEWEAKQELGEDEYERGVADNGELARRFGQFADVRRHRAGRRLQASSRAPPTSSRSRAARTSGSIRSSGTAQRDFDFVQGVAERLPFGDETVRWRDQRDDARPRAAIRRASSTRSAVSFGPDGRLAVWIGVVDERDLRANALGPLALARTAWAPSSSCARTASQGSPPGRSGTSSGTVARAAATTLRLRFARRRLVAEVYADRARYHFSFFEADDVLELLRQTGFRVLATERIETPGAGDVPLRARGAGGRALMCGIAGILDLRGEPVAPGRGRRDGCVDHAPRPGRQRHVRSRADRSREQPPRDHRRLGRGSPADDERRRAPRARLQRRALQLPRAGARARVARADVPLAHRHRGRAARLAGVGAGLPRPLRRDVRVRGLGRPRAEAHARPRPVRRQAALLRRGRRPAAVRLRDQGAARRRPARERVERRAPPVLHLPERLLRRHAVRGRAHAPRRPPPSRGAARRASRSATGTSSSSRTSRSARTSGSSSCARRSSRRSSGSSSATCRSAATSPAGWTPPRSWPPRAPGSRA